MGWYCNMRKGSVENYGREPRTTRGLVIVHKYLACMGVCELSVMRQGTFVLVRLSVHIAIDMK